MTLVMDTMDCRLYLCPPAGEVIGKHRASKYNYSAITLIKQSLRHL